MFDPHRTRYSNRRFYTRKGQVIQAKRIDAPLGIENRLIPMYKEYLIKNKLISSGDLPTPATPSLQDIFYSGDSSVTPIADMTVTVAPIVVNNVVGIAIGKDAEDTSYWIVYVFFIYNSSWSIPTGFSYKTWAAGTSVNARFEAGSNDVLGMSFPIIGSVTGGLGSSANIVLQHKIVDDIVKFE